MNREDLPHYHCRKEVWAVQIASVTRVGGHIVLTFEESQFPPKEMSLSWYTMFLPEAGSYFVIYKDNYEVCIPAGVFEAEYELVD